MRGLLAAAALLAMSVMPALAQQPPDVGQALEPVDALLGQVVPPVLDQTYSALGQNISREDVRMWLWVNMTKGDVNFLGLTLGAGRAEVQAAIHGRLELRVISSDRIRAAAQGESAYNVSAENATFLSTVYIPAEVFRATLAAETIAAFQRSEEDALGKYLNNAVPEMEILTLDFTWSNISPTQVADDPSLTEKPIVLELDLVVQYIRVESIPSLLDAYFAGKQDEGKQAKKDYVAQMKQENGTPLRARDFFAAAAYTQLLNLSLQPGWSLDVMLHLPRGYAFTYFNEEVESDGARKAMFHLEGAGGEGDGAGGSEPAAADDGSVKTVFLASITHRKMVAFALLVALWAVGLVVAMPLRFLYGRLRLPKIQP